jgi:hypothetical protein
MLVAVEGQMMRGDGDDDDDVDDREDEETAAAGVVGNEMPVMEERLDESDNSS